MWGSKVPEVIDALVTAFSAQPELEGVTVWDGPRVSKSTPREMLAVGFTGVEGEAGAESTTEPDGMAVSPDRETLLVRCAAAVLAGSNDIAAARRRAYDIFAAAGQAIVRDPRLGDVVLQASVGSHTLSQDQTTSGAQATVTFDVACEAFTYR